MARRSFSHRQDQSQHLLPVVVTDSGTPALSSTSTLTISVCRCQPAGHCPIAPPIGISLLTLLGLSACLFTLTGKPACNYDGTATC